MHERDGAVVRTVADLVGRAARRDPDHLALVCDTARLTWRELDERVDRAAAALAALGLAPGDRVALQLGNTLDFPVLYAGALRAGLVAVPANTGYTGPELAYLLADSGARALVTSSVQAISSADRAARRLERARARAGRGAVRTGRDAPAAVRAGRRDPGPLARRAAGSPEDLAVLRLHQRHQRPAARRDAVASRAAGEPRPVRRDPPRPWSPRRTCCCWPSRCSTSTG